MNDETDKPDEDWEMSVSNVSPSETAVENNGGGWKMPEPVFRVSKGKKIEKSDIRPLAGKNVLPNKFASQNEQSYQSKAASGNAGRMILGGIFVFFAVLVGILLVVYFLFWR